MIGHYLLGLSEAQENRLLTERLGRNRSLARGGEYRWRDDEDRLVGCIRGCAENFDDEVGKSHDPVTGHKSWNSLHIEVRYDALCDRFGVPRIANAIRSRIWSNRAHRLGQPLSSQRRSRRHRLRRF